MLTFYINRAGKNLSEERHAELEKAKSILSGIIAKQKAQTPKPTSKSAPKKAAKQSSVKSPGKKSASK
jgi:isocitrate/isopropylmalate dehydrogenase